MFYLSVARAGARTRLTKLRAQIGHGQNCCFVLMCLISVVVWFIVYVVCLDVFMVYLSCVADCF